MRRLVDPALELLGPIGLVVLVAVVASQTTSAGNSIQFRNLLVSVAIVVALYVFVGNSGVLSFGHISFVAVGAYDGMAVLTHTMPQGNKTAMTQDERDLVGRWIAGGAGD